MEKSRFQLERRGVSSESLTRGALKLSISEISVTRQIQPTEPIVLTNGKYEDLQELALKSEQDTIRS